MYIQKSLTSIMRNSWLDRAALYDEMENELFWMNESRAFWNYDFTLVDEDSAVVAIQPMKDMDWIYIEMRTICNILE